MQTSIKLPEHVVQPTYIVPRSDPIDDLPSAIEQALTNSLKYPSLAQCTTPEDRVVLALEHAIPQVSAVVEGVVKYLIGIGIQPDQITILQSPADIVAETEKPTSLLSTAWKDQITTVVHDATKCEDLAYLATTSSGKPILLNRLLIESDVVLPIGTFQHEQKAGYFGIDNPLYPLFADQAAQLRFRALNSLNPQGKPKCRLNREVSEVRWLLGATFALQVVPGSSDEILHVLAGEAHTVEHRGRELYQAAWGGSVPCRADLVVATIEGSSVQQTWQNVGHALAIATDLVEENGAIVICCNLSNSPGKAMQYMAHSETHHDALKRIEKDRPDDTFPAVQLTSALHRSHVFLLSQLDEAIVEALDITPLTKPEELTKLCHQFPSCILLSDATRATIEVDTSNC